MKKHTIHSWLASAALFLFLASATVAQSLDAPAITCVTVNVAGSVTINWTQPPDPDGEFTSYLIYDTEDGVNFNLIASLPSYNSTSYTHIGAGANSEARCYQIKAASFDGNDQLSDPSALACSIYTQALQSAPPGDAEVIWSDPLTALDPNLTYKVFLEYPAGVWTQIASVPALSPNIYVHEVSTCGEWLNFRVSLDAGTGCEFISNISGDLFTDATAPPTPVIVSASVDSTSGNAVISWEPSTAGDTDGYILYQCVAGFSLILDTIWGANNTVYENLNSSADVGGSEGYAIASFDTCYTGVPPSPNTSPTNALCHSTMFLTTGWYQCWDKVNLHWTPYIGWTGNVSFYEVYAQTNGGQPQLIGTVDGDVNGYIHEGITPGFIYQYFIKAYANGQSFDAISNRVTVNILTADPPDYLYLSTASVENEDEVTVRLFMQSVPGPFQCLLQRKDRIDGDWIDRTSQMASNVNLLSFIDTGIDTDWQSYQYRIVLYSNCGDSVTVSNTGKTIFLNGVANTQTFVNTLTWSAYSDWDGEVSEYRIYRSVEGFEPMGLIAVVDGSTFHFEDPVADYLQTTGEFCYYVEAFENSNFLGIQETSKSNVRCVLQEPKIWVPNAIIINGFNPIFYPVISFADFSEYRLVIYNRWGDMVFSSTSIDEGWDGMAGGEQVQEGVFMYFISVIDGTGAVHERKGPLYVLIGGKE